MKFLQSLVFFCISIHVYSKTDTVNYISNFRVTQNHNYKGVQGILVEYDISFKDLLIKLENNDSLLSKAEFYFNTILSVNGTRIKPALGYSIMKNNKGNFQHVKRYNNFYFKESVPLKEDFFIPYAALDIDSGKHNISILSTLNGKDPLDNVYQQSIVTKNILIDKPKQKLVTFNIDYVEVEMLNPKNESWDFNIYNNAKPDVKVTFYVANTLIWTDNVKDSYIYAKGPKSKNIIFKISEGDKIRFRVEDIDVLFHDFIGELVISTPIANELKEHTLSKKFGSVKDCSATWKIE